jgi:hypothetical protein
MNRLLKYRHLATVICRIALCVFLLAQCVSNETGKPPVAAAAATPTVTRDQFAGSEACASCHQAIYATHIHTAHYLTTKPATQAAIKGSFRPGSNSFSYTGDMIVRMEKTDSGLYQAGYYRGERQIAKRFDIVVGSASKGQTYITRYHHYLFQLPVSYFSAAHKWANSPQFPAHQALFNRSITSRCLECHTTYAQKMSAPAQDPEAFNTDNIIYGVDCERCHGPGAKHVTYQRQHPTDRTARFIVNPATFTRQQSLDLCILCHGGRLQKTRPSFSFVAGDTLANYFAFSRIPPPPGDIDVHGNQYGLLSASKCFRQSQMTCLTCHDTHVNERGKTTVFSQRCIACHRSGHSPVCKLLATRGAAILTNCIDCHMPLQSSHSITELLPGAVKPTAARIRSHYIAIYAPH